MLWAPLFLRLWLKKWAALTSRSWNWERRSQRCSYERHSLKVWYYACSKNNHNAIAQQSDVTNGFKDQIWVISNYLVIKSLITLCFYTLVAELFVVFANWLTSSSLKALTRPNQVLKRPFITLPFTYNWQLHPFDCNSDKFEFLLTFLPRFDPP